MEACRNKNIDVFFSLSKYRAKINNDILESFTDNYCETIRSLNKSSESES